MSANIRSRSITSMPILACALITLFFFIYGILSSIEFGASLFFLLPRLKKDRAAVRVYLNPVMEATNVFLVTGVVLLFTFFPGAIPTLAALLPLVFSGLLFLGVRIVGLLLIFYGEMESRLAASLLVLGSFAGPMILSGFYVFLLIGSADILPTLGLRLFAALFTAASICLLSFSFFETRGITSVRPLTMFAATAFAVSLAGLVILLKSASAMLFAQTALIVAAASIIIASLVAWNACHEYHRFGLAFASVCVTIATFFGAVFLAHLPYLVYPSMTLDQGFTDPSIAPSLFISFGLTMVLVLPSLWLLLTLFRKSK